MVKVRVRVRVRVRVSGRRTLGRRTLGRACRPALPRCAVAQDEFCESTVGYKNKANGEVFQKLFDCPSFRIGTINDVVPTQP